MSRGTRSWKLALLLAVLALLAPACRGADEGAGGDDAATDDPLAAGTDAPADEPTAATEEPTEADEPTATEDATATEAPTGATEEPTATEGGTAPAGDVATDIGVTEEPCPAAVNPDNGCIYLGVISDLTVGPFAPLAVPITAAQEAFWARVNADGGIGGFDVDATQYVRDNLYAPETHAEVYEEIKPDVLALAQTLGSPTTAAIIEDLQTEGIVAAPASWTSAWEFEDVILESGANYCTESMNSVDWAVENLEGIATVMAVHFPGDYGDDGAAGAAIAAEANGLEFTDTPTTPGQDNQAGAISALASQNPDLVVITTSPTETGTILGQAAAQGFTGIMIATGPGWNKALLQSPAAPAVQAQLYVSGPWREFTADTPGHEAMREALGEVDANDGYTSGWIWSYPMLAALEAAVESGDLTRAGLLEAVNTLENVDYEGMVPEGAGVFSGSPDEQSFRQSVVQQPDPEQVEAGTGVTNVQDYFTGPTAEAYVFEEPCFTSGVLGG